MKKNIFRLIIAFLAVGMLVSCAKVNERIDDLEKRINDVESGKIASISNQVDGIKASIADLNSIKTAVQDVTASTNAQKQEIENLKKADEAIQKQLEGLNTPDESLKQKLEALAKANEDLAKNLEDLNKADEAIDKRIDELKGFVNDELKKYAKSDWVEATFATLAQYEATCDTIAKIDARIGSLDAKLSKAITDCAESMKGWVNEQLKGYYTIAEIDAKAAALQEQLATAGDEAKAKADSIGAELAKTRVELDTVKANITAEYRKAIEDAIKTSEGKINQTISQLFAKVNMDIINLYGRVAQYEGTVNELTGRLDKLEKMIQSVVLLGDYDDGSLKYENDSVTINFIVNPAGAIKGLTQDSVKVLVRKVLTKTKAVSEVKIDTIAVKEENFDTLSAKGLVSVKVELKDYLPASADSAIMVAVNVKKGLSDFTTEFVPVYVAAPVAPKGFVDLGVMNAEGKPLYWAEKNLGASNPEDYGKYYSWGDITGQTPSGSTFSKSFSWDNDVFGQTFNKVAQTTACPDGVLAQTYDVAYQTNNAWRMPTKEDFSELAKQCFLEWTDNYNSTGVKGVIVWKAKGDDAGWFKPSTAGKGLKIKDDGSKYNNKVDHTFSNTYAIGTDPCVFFPAAGDCSNGTSLSGENIYGSYWSGSLSFELTDARRLYFGTSNVNLQMFDFRYYGFSVRPVSDK